MPRLVPPALFLAAVAAAGLTTAADPPAGADYLAFIRKSAADLRAADKPPATAEEWARRRAELRKNLLAAWGGFPETPCPLDPKKLGELKRDGYTVEKLVFQTRPGVWMTANAYMPHRSGKLPAILMVHGHWRGAKQDPVVQARCIGAAKLGFFVLCVDAFGAGERGVGTALGEYHGDMTAAALLPVGLPLAGLQVYENMRAVDYLLTRPEVDGTKLGITGASGGGNQTMYAGAFDERFKAVVPVCSVGNYQAYLGPACCMCEVVPGALKFTEEGDVLGLVAPRALMVVNATKDASQFSVGEARKSVARAGTVFELLGKPGNLKHAIFESPHDYSKAMREAMYGWMTLHLKGEGNGDPIPEPAILTEKPEDLRCYPGDTRPKDYVTIPRFAAAEARKLLAAKPQPATADDWAKQAEVMRKNLVEKSLGGFPNVKPERATTGIGLGQHLYNSFTPEPGIQLVVAASIRLEKANPAKIERRPLVVLLSVDGWGTSATSRELERAAVDADWRVLHLDLRSTGKNAPAANRVGRSPDHNTAEWGLWIGRPLLGQWVQDARAVVELFEPFRKDGDSPSDINVIGEGPAGLVALCAAATDKRITKAAAVGSLVSYVTEEPYTGQRLGLMAPGILRDVGDVAHVAALAAPKRVVIAGGVDGNGKPLAADQLREAYKPAARAWELTGAAKALTVTDSTDPAAVIAALK
jgi:dienelactone hydrolase